MSQPKKIGVETDGDREPLDVYLIDDQGNRVATIEGHSTAQMRHFAERLARAYNRESDALKALKTLVEMHADSFFICGVDDQPAVDLTLRQARDAIAKAESITLPQG